MKSSHKEIKELFITHGLYQLIKLPTYVTQATKFLIDVIMTNMRSNVHHTKVLRLSLSDHDCVMCVIVLHKIDHQKMPFRTITGRDYSKYSDKVLAHNIENYDWNPVYTETNVNIALDYMEQGLTTIIIRHAPKITKPVKGCKCPWLSYKIKTLINTRDKIIRRAQKTNKECQWSSYKRLKNLCNNKVKQAKQKYQKDLLFENKNKPTKFCNCIRNVSFKRICTYLCNHKHRQ